MEYVPVGNAQESIVAGAELSPESALLFMSIVEEMKEVEERLQEQRENAFFDSDMIADVKPQDVVDDSILTQKHLKSVNTANLSDWSNTVVDCYRYNESREPETPLDRLHSVSHNFDLPTIDTNSLRFDVEDARLLQTNSGEVVEIQYDESSELRLFIDTDNMEFYQGMYDPPITRDISSLGGWIEQFDSVTIRNNTDAAIDVMEYMGPDTVQRNITETEILFTKDLDNLIYLPDDRVSEIDDGGIMAQDVKSLRMLEPLPNENTKKELLRTLERGYVDKENTLRLLELISDRTERTSVSYSWIAKPPYLEEVARLTGTNIVSVPQDMMLLFTDEPVPEWLRSYDDKFPEYNELTQDEHRRVSEYVDTPSFVDITNSWQENIRAKEILLRLFERSEIAQDDIVSYYLVPWDDVDATEKSVLEAIEYGQQLREHLRDIDEQYDTEVYDSTVRWEQRRIYRRSEFPMD